MTTLVSEHYYLGLGTMRPVVCAPGVGKVCFALDGAEGEVQLSYDPSENIKKGKAQWLTYLGGSAGEASAASGVRVVLRRIESCAKLTVVEIFNESETHG